MACLDTIDCGASRARKELVFLFGLLIKLGCCRETISNFSVSLGFTDIYRIPAMGADDFISLEKAPEDLLELLSTFRALAMERVEKLVEEAGHGPALPERANTTPDGDVQSSI